MANSGVFYSNQITVNAKSQPGGKIYDTQQQLKWEVVNSDSATTAIRFTLSALLSEKGQWYAIGPTTITYNVNGQSYTKVEDRKRCSTSNPTIISWKESFLNNSSTDNVTVSNISSTSVNLGFSSDSLVISNKSFTTDKVEYIHNVTEFNSSVPYIVFDNNKYKFIIDDISWLDSTTNQFVDMYKVNVFSGKMNENGRILNTTRLATVNEKWSYSGSYATRIESNIIPVAGEYVTIILERYKNNVSLNQTPYIVYDNNKEYQVPGSLVYLFNNGSWITCTPWIYDNSAWRRGDGTYIYEDEWKKSSIDNSATVPTKKRTTRKKKTATN